MSKPNSLILFIKYPEPGRVKTRLQPELSPEHSYLLYRAMVEDLVSNLGTSASFNLSIFFWPPQKIKGVRDWLGEHHHYVAQSAGDLGEKMHSAFVAASGISRKTIVIGSDLPTIDQTLIENAFSMLDQDDLVLGPSTDGGYYLIGMKQSNARIFSDIIWSTPTVLERTLANANALDMKVGRLRQMSDVDTIHEVRALWDSLRNTKDAANQAPRTFEVLTSLFT